MFVLSYSQLANQWRRYARMDDRAFGAALGWNLGQGVAGQRRNGAVLASLALLSAGVAIGGNVPILQGPLSGKRVHSGANHLARWLAEHRGAPEVLSTQTGLADVAYRLFGQRGLVAFIQNTGPAGGDIQLLDGHNAQALCCQAQHRHPYEVHFWRFS